MVGGDWEWRTECTFTVGRLVVARWKSANKVNQPKVDVGSVGNSWLPDPANSARWSDPSVSPWDMIGADGWDYCDHTVDRTGLFPAQGRRIQHHCFNACRLDIHIQATPQVPVEIRDGTNYSHLRLTVAMSTRCRWRIAEIVVTMA